MKIIGKALVIIPTIYSSHVNEAIQSVKNQTYPDVDVLLVIDGEVSSQYSIDADPEYPIYKMQLPWNVGKDGGNWYGHRTYASVPKLIPEKYEYVLFLDEDNTFQPGHVESMVDMLEANHEYRFVHSLRRVIDKEGNFLVNDECESLGKTPIMNQAGHHLIDTSSFCFRRAFIRNTCTYWDTGWGGDRKYLQSILGSGACKWSDFDSTGQHTLNYRLDGNEGSVTKEFFIEGNERMKNA